MSQSLSSRPSELLNIRHPVSAFWLDRAVHSLGSMIESEIEAATEDAKTMQQAHASVNMVMNRWMAPEGKGRYRDPAAGR